MSFIVTTAIKTHAITAHPCTFQENEGAAEPGSKVALGQEDAHEQEPSCAATKRWGTSSSPLLSLIETHSKKLIAVFPWEVQLLQLWPQDCSGKKTHHNCQYEPCISPVTGSPLTAGKSDVITDTKTSSLSGSKAETTPHISLVPSREAAASSESTCAHVCRTQGLTSKFSLCKYYPETTTGNTISYQQHSLARSFDF